MTRRVLLPALPALVGVLAVLAMWRSASHALSRTSADHHAPGSASIESRLDTNRTAPPAPESQQQVSSPSTPTVEGRNGQDSPSTLLPDLDSTDVRDQIAAANLLPRGLPSESVLALIKRWKQTKDDALRYYLLKAIAYSDAPRSMIGPVLMASADQLVKLGDDEQVLLETFDTTNPAEFNFVTQLYHGAPEDARWHVLNALVDGSRDPHVFEYVKELVQTGDLPTRAAVVMRLPRARGNYQPILDYLGGIATSDPSSEVRRFAKEAIERISVQIQDEAYLRRLQERQR